MNRHSDLGPKNDTSAAVIWTVLFVAFLACAWSQAGCVRSACAEVVPPEGRK